MRQHTIPTPYMVGDVHVYSAEIDGELVLFDTGPGTSEALAVLQKEIDLKRLKYIFITHGHVDHCGLAAHFAKHSTAEILLPRKDGSKMQYHGERLDHIQAFLSGYGFDDAFAQQLRGIFRRHRIFPDVPERFTIVEDSHIPRKLGIRWLNCPGHSQSDLVYLCGKHAVTGDVLLRNIFQAPLLDVNLETMSGRFRNYDAYCKTLLELDKLRGYEICPGHRMGIDGIDATITFYIRKLLERASQVKKYASADSVRELINRLFEDTRGDPFVIFLKVSEVVFMLDFLAAPEKLASSLERIGLTQAARDARLLTEVQRAGSRS
ncbi:MAG TPA: MBL fold metallo-hydrolase [Nitrospirota bacterium]|nr:MBL fold metallo-hydrolase [Nitrospirota bacterium]